MFFLPWLEVLRRYGVIPVTWMGTLTLLGVRLGELEVRFPELLIVAPVFTSHFRGHQNPLTTNLFLVLASWSFLEEELYLSWHLVRLQQDKPMEGGPKEFRGFLIGPGIMVGHMASVLLPRVANETSWFKPVYTLC